MDHSPCSGVVAFTGQRAVRIRSPTDLVRHATSRVMESHAPWMSSTHLYQVNASAMMPRVQALRAKEGNHAPNAAGSVVVRNVATPTLIA